VEEEESEDEGNDAGRQFVWDAAKGMLVEKSEGKKSAAVKAKKSEGRLAATGQSKAQPDTDAGEAQADGAEGAEASAEGAEASAGGDDDAEGSESESSGEPDEEMESKAAFLNEASTPELIKQAVAVGGSMAASVTDRWVLDRATKLHFRYDSRSKQMHCWMGAQGCMYVWKQRGKMEFLWASPSGPSESPPPDVNGPGNGAAPPPAGSPAASQKQEVADADVKSLWVTIIPPAVLMAGGLADPGTVLSEEVEVSQKALAGVIGKGGAKIQEIEKACGVKASAQDPREGETTRRIRIEGTKSAIADAKAALQQQLVVVLGEKAAEKLQKHADSQLLERKRAESGSDAAKIGVGGLSEFAEKWGLKAVMARKLAKLDAMLQRHLMRHFKPLKAKPANALRGFTVALMKHPQRWRLEALYEDGELDGEICETVPVDHAGAVVGRQREAADQEDAGEEQLIELEVNTAHGALQASRTFGDVQPRHCKLLRMGTDFYAWAQESQIGTGVDGHKYRQQDGPVPLQDGSVINVGKYLIYCEVGTAASLQRRRTCLLAGERLWQAGWDASGDKKEEAVVAELDADAVDAEADDDADMSHVADEDGGPGKKRKIDPDASEERMEDASATTDDTAVNTASVA